MTLPIKSILSCLVILVTTSDIHTRQIVKSGCPKQLAVSKDKTTILGEGAEPSQLPIITYSPHSPTFDVSIYIQTNKKCDLGFPDFSGTKVDIKTIKQLGRNIIVFVWSVTESVADTATVSIVDMNACSIKKNLIIIWDSSSKNSFAVVPFEDGFDVFTSDNTRRSYDANGNQLSEDAFPINSQDFSISAVSKIPSSYHFFIVDKDHQALNIVTDNGKLVKQLLHFHNQQVFSNNEQSLYSICSLNLKIDYFVIECFQYAEDGTKKWHNNVALRFPAVLDVKNLAEGGLVFAALSFDGNQLSLVKMGPKQVQIWRYSENQIFTRVRLIEFSETDHTFVLAYEQGISEESIMSQKYSFVP